MAQKFIPTRPSGKRSGAVGRFTRASGDAGDRYFIRIVDMPHYGKLFIDGREWMGGGRWDEDEPTVWKVPNPPNGRVLRVEDAQRNARGRDMGQVVAWGTRDSGEFDWDTLTPIADTGATVRIIAPHSSVIVDGIMRSGSSGSNRTYEVGHGPGHTVSVVGIAPDFQRWTFQINIPAGQQQTLNLIPSALDTALRSSWEVTPAGADQRLTISGLPTGTTGLVVTANGRVLVGTMSFPSWSIAVPAAGTYELQVRPVTTSGIGNVLQRVVDIGTTSIDVPFASLRPIAPTTGSIALIGVPASWAVLLDGAVVAPEALGSVVAGRHDVGTRPPTGLGADIVRSVMVTQGLTATANLSAEVAARLPIYTEVGVGTLTLTGGQAGWSFVLAPAAANTPTLLAAAATAGLTRNGPVLAGNTVIAPPLPLGAYSLLIGRPDGVAPVRPVQITEAPTQENISSAFPTASAPVTGTVTVTAVAGWKVGLALRSAPSVLIAPPVTIPESGGLLSPPLPVGDYVLGVAFGDRATTRDFSITAGVSTLVDVRSIFDAAATGTLSLTGGQAGWSFRMAPASAPHAWGASQPLTGPTFGPVTVSVGNYILGVTKDGVERTGPFSIVASQSTTRDLSIAPYFPAGTGTTSTLSVSGGQAGWRVRWAPIATPDAWNEGHVLTATTGGPWTVPMGRYALLVTRADGTEARGSFAMLSDPYTESLSSYFPAAGTNGGITATGTAGWRLALTSTGSTTPVAIAVIPPSGSVTIPAAPGSYSLTVSDDAGHSETRTIVVPTRGLDVNTAEYLASALRPTQGPAPIAGAAPRGTLILSGVPGPSRVLVGGIFTWDTDGTARPIEFSLPVGTHSITANPPQGAPQRRGSVAIAAGARVEVLYGSLTTGQTITADPNPPMVEVDLVQNYVGPILDRPAWAPVTASPGDILRAPDGVNYRVELARAPAVGVVLVRMKADGTPDVAPDVAPPQAPVAEGMSTAKKGAIVVGILGLGGAAYYYWTHRATGAAAVKNPARRR